MLSSSGTFASGSCSSTGLPPRLPMAPPPPPGSVSAAAAALPGCRPASTGMGPRSGDVSEGPSESSANIEDTEEDDFQSTIPNLERFYEQMAAKARLPTHPPGNGANANWVLSLARSYRRLSKDKRSRGRLRALLSRPGGPQGDLAEASPTTSLLTASSCGPGGLRSGLPLQRPTTVAEQPGWSSNTDDSGYEAGYETDADESELSEWEGGPARHGHKRKLDALVQLTMRLSVVERGGEEEGAALAEAAAQLPPLKTPRAFGTRAVGLRLSLDKASGPPPTSSTAAAAAAVSAVAPWQAFDSMNGAAAGTAAAAAAAAAAAPPTSQPSWPSLLREGTEATAMEIG
mmetsp:Transcript_34768/g.88335  ORF Transcript_34768/g.88335 Transcript_34768/m.88335 type:complete len:345 (-) Transcript_34768:73-1107(-)